MVEYAPVDGAFLFVRRSGERVDKRAAAWRHCRPTAHRLARRGDGVAYFTTACAVFIASWMRFCEGTSALRAPEIISVIQFTRIVV
jgi:hypothetical protein